jgi:hypothetical protein
MRHLVGVGVKMEKARRKLKPQVEAINKELESALRGLKKDMLAGKEASASAYSAKVKAAEGKLGEVRKQLRQEAVLCEAYAKAILTPNQREKCYNYEHCLIPVKNLADPTRVGSADAGSIAEKLLDKVRTMSDEELKDALPGIIASHFAKMNKYLGELSKADEEKEKSKMVRLFNEARAMSTLDYQVQKSRLAAQIPCDYSEVKDRLKAISKLACKLESEKGDGKSTGVIGSMFLKPCMIPLLSERINILQDWDNYEAVDLDKVEAASNWTERRGNLPKGRGLGMACSHYVSGAAKPVHWTGEPHAVVSMKLDFDGSVTVLTADDIRLSGAASLTDVLRRVVGVSGEKAVQAIDAGQRLIDLSYAAYLHDVGKVKVPDGILNKAEPLTEEEWKEMRRHPEYGEEMLKEMTF